MIAVHLFKGRVRVFPDGRREIDLMRTWPSSYGIDPVTRRDYYEIVLHAQKAAEAHKELLQVDPDYRARWEEASRKALSMLPHGTHVSYATANRIVYPVLLRACIYENIFSRIGHPKVKDHPYYDGKDDPRIWGPEDSPFFSVDYVEAPTWPASVMPFHYCAGTGGLAVSGGEDEPHVRAMPWLEEHDPGFRRDREEVLRKVAPEAEKVDPLDVEAGNRVTDLWRRLLVEGGDHSLAARIEARVREEARERAGREQREPAPPGSAGDSPDAP